MDGLRRELTGVSFESDDMDATVPSEENGTDLNCHQRCLEKRDSWDLLV